MQVAGPVPSLRVGERYSSSYAPSAGVYYLCASKPAADGGRDLILGIPDPVAKQIVDELRGLVRGLLYAGTQGVLVTLWDVNDQSTANFMKLFYENLQAKGVSKAEAVQRSMREVRKRYAHPFYWAPFVLVGKHD